ncbi:hypothetical protein A2344_01005 [Candidatus Peregrinibacteria bacterium RIFOXYB12_FULL_41_12]|nr:MAG: hypothetical protein A2244_05410 [Candidatus Peregrinibacteria bacterium RIFOXYA2_FULL_41_18]OGJ49134.1 MAG: hypothetical protein A2344_01005 [Candidatus Peregrinibacteria bacterium RIFOXYB12_FULL_41_12]OGJ52474.1 MAG: hypothetical protein A2336_01445 [Candidatus Peregrinibacteria bacterium RIFOXYB2_FULL_41_88]OGJ53310.1 MAG: hypothetical protein A2448_01445 [Candidatus Peregrinibacteria bacterium RIFOXYC2_FULL_41_22]
MTKFNYMKEFKAKLVSAKGLTADVKHFVFEAEEDFPYESGQFVMVEITDGKDPSGVSRAYSIASAPDGKRFELLVKILPDGRGSQFLNGLQDGAVLNFKGPFGHFLMDTSSKKDVLFVATGTGLAPIRAMINANISSGRNVKLFFGVRYLADIFMEEEFKDLGMNYKICVSRPEGAYSGFVGRVTDLIEKTDFDYKNLQVYICGSKQMSDSVRTYFLGKGVLPEDIKNEVF